MKITFYGATQEVTGSRYLLEYQDTKVLVDCGMFQGEKELSSRNYEPFPVDPKTIDAIVLTHAHIDHTGYLPALVKNGFKGTIYCSRATLALCSILLADSGHIQEEEQKEHKQILYTTEDAEKTLKLFRPVEYDTNIVIEKLVIKLIRSGHILGAAFVVVSNGDTTITFSGDLGRPNQIIMPAPPQLEKTDYLVLESTYGDRLHKDTDPIEKMGSIINQTLARDGVVVIPAFAVDRTQEVLYCLYTLREQNKLPKVPIFLDSPMAIKVNGAYCAYKDEHKFPVELCNKVFAIANYTTTSQESKKINGINKNAIVIAGSGMANGGRVLHHLKHYLGNKKNTILFVGYQAEGTLGRELIDGAEEVSIDDKTFNVRADIQSILSFSAHADYNEILQWLSSFEHSPKKVFLTHGELHAAQALQQKIKDTYGWPVVIPAYKESFELI